MSTMEELVNEIETAVQTHDRKQLREIIKDIVVMGRCDNDASEEILNSPD